MSILCLKTLFSDVLMVEKKISIFDNKEYERQFSAVIKTSIFLFKNIWQIQVDFMWKR